MNYAYSFNNISDDALVLAGGKGAALCKMFAKGLNVPDGFVILSSAFEDNKLKPEAKADIERCLSALPNVPLAVRSSALSEDSAKTSFAGEFESVLDVPKESLYTAIDRVAASAYSERVSEYSAFHEITEGHKIAVVIQIMINAEMSGVLFSADPITGSHVNMVGNFYMGFAYQTEEYARLWYKVAKDANANCIRLHAQVYPEFYLEIADEAGILIIDETATWASHCQFYYTMNIIENSKKHLERLIKRDRNHPSVIVWSVENECIFAYRVSADVGVKDEEELNSLIYLLAEHAYKLDPTRPASGDGSYDMGGD